MNIIFIYLKAFSHTGGIEAFNKKFVKALDEICVGDVESVKILSIHDSEIGYNSPNKRLDYYGFSGSYLSSLRTLLKFIRRDTIVFYGHINILPFAIILLLLRVNARSYFIIHGIDVWRRFSGLYRLFLRKFNFLSVSNFTKHEFSRKNSVDLDRISIFPNCIDIDNSTNLSPYNESFFNLLSVSRLDPNDSYKGIDSLIKSIPHLVRTIPNFKLTVIGKGEDKKRLMNIASGLNILDKIEFKGYVEDIESYYEHCDVFALPSDGEGFGIVYLEALKYSKPVIAANSGGATDVIIDNVTGKLCNYDDIHCLANTLIDISQNQSRYSEIGKFGNDHLMKNFTFEKYKANLKKILINISDE
jgi:glycosyltransferase involved in cell wall biosynthesis